MSIMYLHGVQDCVLLLLDLFRDLSEPCQPHADSMCA
jgi:hypothetical protein